MKKISSLLMILLCFQGCVATKTNVKYEEVDASKISLEEGTKAEKIIFPEKKKYKRKIIIGRFTNSTNYGSILLSENEYNKIAKQAADILCSRLVKTDRYIVLERPDFDLLKKEQANNNLDNIVGTDAIIVGSIVEFGRNITGKKGFLSQTKLQKANATVELRMIDVSNGHVFFSATGKGEASLEVGSFAGYGSTSSYDNSLNDKAISAAISEVINKLILDLEARSWKTDVLDIQENKIYISGGKYQGIKVGDELVVMKKTKTIKSKQSGFNIELPAERIAKIKVIQLFGENEVNEGAVCDILEGKLDSVNLKNLFVTEEG